MVLEDIGKVQMNTMASIGINSRFSHFLVDKGGLLVLNGLKCLTYTNKSHLGVVLNNSI